MKRLAALVLVLIFLSACGGRSDLPTIGIDGSWDVDSAKYACWSAAKGGDPCFEDAPSIAKRAETDLENAFAENPACNGLSIVDDFYSPKTDRGGSKVDSAPWVLMFDISAKGGSLNEADTTWTLVGRRTNRRGANGKLGNLRQAATDICTVVKDNGGKVF